MAPVFAFQGVQDEDRDDLVSATMTSPLDRLFLLQEVLFEVDAKTLRRGRTPDHLVHVEAAYFDARRQRDDAGAVLSQAGERKKALDFEIQDFNEQMKKYQQQLQSVKTSREYCRTDAKNR